MLVFVAQWSYFSISSLGMFRLSPFASGLPVPVSSRERRWPYLFSCSDFVQPATWLKVLPPVFLGLLFQASRVCNALTHVPFPQVFVAPFSVSTCKARIVSILMFHRYF
jgi:hypothetical protein